MPSPDPAATAVLSRGDRLLAAGAAFAFALLAALQSGRIHPDEVYQFLEPANRAAFHYGFQAWEFRDGLRNWAVPGLLAGAIKAIDALGWKTALGHRIAAALVVALLSYPGLRATLAYARRRTNDGATATLALLLVCGWATSIYFLGRTLGEPIGALFGVAGIEALDRPGDRRRDGVSAGVWLGLAVVVRYAFAALVVAVIVQELTRRRWRVFLPLAIGGGTIALALGALDWVTWGHPFHSMRAYLHYNLLNPDSTQRFGRAPAFYFLPVLAQWFPWPLVVGARRMEWRRDRLLMPAALYFAAISVTPHKEDRFVVPVVLMICCALAPPAAIQLVAWWRDRGVWRWMSAGVLTVFVACSGFVYSRLPDLESDLFWATMRMGTDSGMTGLIIVNESRYGCGGSFYLGRDFDVQYTGPGYPGFFDAMRNRRINRAIVFRGVGVHDLERYGFRTTRSVGSTAMMQR